MMFRTLSTTLVAIAALLLSPPTPLMAADSPKTSFGQHAEFKAVDFAGDEKDSTKKLNDLAADGWEYVGPLGHGLVAFRRTAAAGQKNIAGLVAAAKEVSAAHTGPTPYPDSKDEAAWPGKGPIRVFGWMVDNRNYFWTQREKDAGAVVFVGDSLTGNWDAKSMAAAFPGMKIANRGIGGDVSRGVLFRLKEDVLDLKPKAMVLCIGTNDLSTHADPAIVEQNIAAILAEVRKYDPKLPIVLCTTPPRDAAEAPTRPGAQADLNARIAKLGAAQQNLTVIDLFTPMASADGKPIPELFAKDKLHFAAPGYQKWTELLKPALEKLGAK